LYDKKESKSENNNKAAIVKINKTNSSL